MVFIQAQQVTIIVDEQLTGVNDSASGNSCLFDSLSFLQLGQGCLSQFPKNQLRKVAVSWILIHINNYVLLNC